MPAALPRRVPNHPGVGAAASARQYGVNADDAFAAAARSAARWTPASSSRSPWSDHSAGIGGAQYATIRQHAPRTLGASLVTKRRRLSAVGAKLPRNASTSPAAAPTSGGAPRKSDMSRSRSGAD